MKVKREILRSKVTGDIYKVREYDERGNLTYFKDNFNGKGYEEWRTYDQNNNLTCSIDSNGTEIVNLYSDNGVKIREDIYEYEFYPEEVKVEEPQSWKSRIEKLVSEKVLVATSGVSFAVGVVLSVVVGIIF